MQKLKAHWLQILTHVGALLPLAILAWDYAQNQLTANPIREITIRTGRSAIVLLLLSLACTPIYTLFGFAPVLRLRRPLGLYAFLYAGLHGLTFVGLDYGFDLVLIGQELLQKRFVQVGVLAFLILVPLAITSTRGWVARLGKNWKRLHRLVYLAALLAGVHFLWAVKANVRVPLLYGAVLAVLLVARIPAVQNAVRGWRGGLRRD
ncbi:MAG TPA: protein-methionine-sulfoxide reductase heme-binding subunit MsrQ [Anaerolineae bacterium]|nr:protein-methionine-sulfoxide reductase heme-binding subunit MsrQ [Anaerolineae bacterium]